MTQQAIAQPTFFREFGYEDAKGFFHRGLAFVKNEDDVQDYLKWIREKVQGPKSVLEGLYAFSGDPKTDDVGKLVISGLMKGHLAFDLDLESDPSVALRDARKLIDYFQTKNVDEQSINIWFSGSKGFHVMVHCAVLGAEPREDLTRIFKEIALRIADQAGVRTLDKKIYHKSRLWRIPETVNGKTGMYKIGLSIAQLRDLKLDEIKKLAEVNKGYKAQFLPSDPVLANLYAEAVVRLEERAQEFQEMPVAKEVFENDCKCIQEARNGVDEGLRNEACYMIALNDKLSGKSKEEVLEYLNKDWNPRVGLSDQEIQSTVESVFSRNYKWSCEKARDAGLDCDPSNCPKYKTNSNLETFLKRPSLLNDLVESLDDRIVGEKDLRAMIIALNVGGQSLRVSGDSSTGKNNLVDGALSLFPEDSYVKITGWSDKAIRYLPTDVSTLYIAEMPHEEMSGGRESTADFDIKLAISEGGLQIMVVVRDPDTNMYSTKMKTTSLRNIIFTSTEFTEAAQLANRIWDMETDASAETTRAVIERKLSRWTQLKSTRKKFETKRITAKSAVRLVLDEAPSPDNVVIPYADSSQILGFFDMVPRARRDADKLCALISSLARLHYLQLPRIKDGGETLIVATPEIYLLAYLIGKRALLTTFSGLSERLKEAFRKCMEVIELGDPLNKTTLAAHMGVSQRTANLRLEQLIASSLLVLDKNLPEGQRIPNHKKSNQAEEMLERTVRDKDLKMVYQNICKAYEKHAIEFGYDPKDCRQQFINPVDGKPCDDWRAKK